MKSEKALQQAKHHLAPEQSYIFNVSISSEIRNFKKIRHKFLIDFLHSPFGPHCLSEQILCLSTIF